MVSRTRSKPAAACANVSSRNDHQAGRDGDRNARVFLIILAACWFVAICTVSTLIGLECLSLQNVHGMQMRNGAQVSADLNEAGTRLPAHVGESISRLYISFGWIQAFWGILFFGICLFGTSSRLKRVAIVAAIMLLTILVNALMIPSVESSTRLLYSDARYQDQTYASLGLANLGAFLVWEVPILLLVAIFVVHSCKVLGWIGSRRSVRLRRMRGPGVLGMKRPRVEIGQQLAGLACAIAREELVGAEAVPMHGNGEACPNLLSASSDPA